MEQKGLHLMCYYHLVFFSLISSYIHKIFSLLLCHYLSYYYHYHFHSHHQLFHLYNNSTNFLMLKNNFECILTKSKSSTLSINVLLIFIYLHRNNYFWRLPFYFLSYHHYLLRKLFFPFTIIYAYELLNF